MSRNTACSTFTGHPRYAESVLKFLAFEQTFKNALTMLPMGGGKGGSDFDPKGKSPGEVGFMAGMYKNAGSRFI